MFKIPVIHSLHILSYFFLCITLFVLSH